MKISLYIMHIKPSPNMVGNIFLVSRRFEGNIFLLSLRFEDVFFYHTRFIVCRYTSHFLLCGFDMLLNKSLFTAHRVKNHLFIFMFMSVSSEYLLLWGRDVNFLIYKQIYLKAVLTTLVSPSSFFPSYLKCHVWRSTLFSPVFMDVGLCSIPVSKLVPLL